MLKLAVPVLHISSAEAAEDFYCRHLGFQLEFAHRGDPNRPDPSYLGISRDGIRIHLSSFSGDAVSGGAVNLVVDDVDALHSEFLAKAVPINLPPINQTWGTREMYVRDPDGNSLRFQQLK
jgi:catechol 2,3-dioxygenase-like lactoylglutathione lyase family enzyme